MQHVLILGAGFAGLELATRLSETLTDEVRVTLIDRNDGFFFGFSKLEVMLGRQTADEVKPPYSAIAKEGVAFRQETVRSIALRGVARLADGETLEYDLFVRIPLHRAPEPLAASGLAVNGWVPVDQANLHTELSFLRGDPEAQRHEPSLAFAAEKEEFGATRRARWFGLD